MHQRAKTALTALAIATVVVVSMDAYTYAGTGDSLLLGKSNKANRTTHVTNNGNGAALSLHAKGSRAPLAVDSSAKVVRLNADSVDGKDASALQNNVRVYSAKPGTASTNGALRFHLPQLPAGNYLATYTALLEGSDGTLASPTMGRCYLTNGNDQVAGYTSTLSVQDTLGMSGSGVIVSKANRHWYLSCFAEQSQAGGKDWTVAADNPVRVTVTPIDRRLGSSFAAVG